MNIFNRRAVPHNEDYVVFSETAADNSFSVKAFSHKGVL